jgi:hypothetical protein
MITSNRPFGRVPAQMIKLRPLIPAFGAGYAVVAVELDDLNAHAGGNVALISRRFGRHEKRRPFEGAFLPALL